MTKPLNPFETSRMLICLLVARFLLPQHWISDWISLDWFTMIQLLHLRDHCSHEFTFSMTRLELQWWMKLEKITNYSQFWIETNGFSGSFLISLTGYFPVIQDNMPTVPAFRGSAVSCLPKSSEHCQRHPEVVKVVAVLLQTPPNITASGPYTNLNPSIYHLYHLDVSRPFQTYSILQMFF